MRTYLVTGGAGFIGSNYIHYMFRKYGDEIFIINVDVLTYAGNPENLADVENRPNYRFVRANICDKEAIRKVFAEYDIDRVVHFAAESHVDRSIVQPELFVTTNVLGTANMLNCAKEAWELPDGSFKEGKKFLHVSTDEVYGSLPEDGGYFYETTPYAPHSPYSASKAGSDLLVKAYMDTYHFPANITNCSNNYGPYQFPEKLIPLMIHNALEGKKLPVYISIDRDILRPDVFRTDWDQGDFSMEELSSLLLGVVGARRCGVIGIDICGGFGAEMAAYPESMRLNEKNNLDLYQFAARLIGRQ